MDDSSYGGALDQGQVTLVEKSEFLQNWKTDFVSFILGLVVSGMLNVALNRIEDYVWRPMEVATVYFIDLIYLIFVVIYALKVYPSLFTDKPMLKSKKSASFLNAFTGGLIFGAIWCSALTKGKKGVSQYVLSALIVIGIAVVVFLNLNAASVVNSQSGNVAGRSTTTSTTGGADASYEEVERDFLAHPEKYVTTDKARNLINAGRVGSWANAPDAIQNVTFGYYASSTWAQDESHIAGSDALDAESAFEVVLVVVSQMFGSYDVGADFIQQLADDYTQIADMGRYGPLFFELGDHKYTCCITFWIKDSKDVNYSVVIAVS